MALAIWIRIALIIMLCLCLSITISWRVPEWVWNAFLNHGSNRCLTIQHWHFVIPSNISTLVGELTARRDWRQCSLRPGVSRDITSMSQLSPIYRVRWSFKGINSDKCLGDSKPMSRQATVGGLYWLWPKTLVSTYWIMQILGVNWILGLQTTFSVLRWVQNCIFWINGHWVQLMS